MHVAGHHVHGSTVDPGVEHLYEMRVAQLLGDPHLAKEAPAVHLVDRELGSQHLQRNRLGA